MPQSNPEVAPDGNFAEAMDASTPIEQCRQGLQSELDAGRTQKERNQLGQFATPTLLADDVLRCAYTLLREDRQVRFLDPAIGTGSFYSALLRVFPNERIAAAAGFEIDPYYGEPARQLWRDGGLRLTIADFTTAKPPSSSERFNLIICNPPYVRHHHIDRAEKSRLLAAATAACTVQMASLAGLYCYFLGLAHAWLADDGIAGWLIPSEFMDVNYGVPVKQYLLNQVELLRIHRFDPNALQFGDALVSSAVVWFRKRRPDSCHKVAFTFGGTLAAPSQERLVPATALQGIGKWTGLATGGIRVESDGLRLGHLFSIKRGLATGSNKFFIMTRAEINQRGLPMALFRPILPGPRYLETDIIEAERDGTPKIARQQFMLDCRLPQAEVRADFPKLWAYLETGKNVAETYLCRHRTPWYAQENRPAPPFLCTYMGRGLTTRAKPFRFILNRSQATAANVYLLLYPKPVLERALRSNPDLAHSIWEFLDSISPETLLGEGRVYGGGLYKMEPKELANVPAEAIAALLPQGQHRPASQIEMFHRTSQAEWRPEGRG